ncbi:MAG TPA: DNA starvation/stationary phase protection protein [Streptosporangiaceae bacterium]|jgi:starvation-inducible DNA-binding protein|nr:DNA starvation/stationary phase protection protein [Streptosporangiaceae bacterium]
MDTERIGTDLQDTLVELTGLALEAKQLHWNVTGRHFRSLHEQLDSLTDEARAAADAVAERAVTIGYAPDGRAATVAKESPLAEVPEGRLADSTVLDLVVTALTTVTGRLRPRVERLGELDPVTQDVLIGVLAGLEKQRWMFSAQQS